jgi:hypothetical protein
MIDIETRIEILLAYFAASNARLLEIEKKLERIEQWQMLSN